MSISAETLARYTDDALDATINRPGEARGIVREAMVLLTTLTDPADRFEAVCRAGGIQNRVPMRWSEAVAQAARQVRDGQPRFIDEYHASCPTAPVR